MCESFCCDCFYGRDTGEFQFVYCALFDDLVSLSGCCPLWKNKEGE